MKNIFILVSLLFVPAFAHWINKSELLMDPSKRSGTECEYVQCSARQEMVFTLDNQKTTKWRVRAEGPSCTLSIVKGSTIIKSCFANNGSCAFNLLLEAGAYKAVSTANARISFFEWRVHTMKAMIPEGGGATASIIINNKKTSYFRAAPDTIPKLKVKGPTTMFIYVRADVPENETISSVDVTITDKVNGKVISHKTVSKRKSKKAVYMDTKTIVPAKAFIISFDVPIGNHEYAVELKGTHGSVKFYTESRKNGNPHRRTIRW